MKNKYKKHNSITPGITTYGLITQQVIRRLRKLERISKASFAEK